MLASASALASPLSPIDTTTSSTLGALGGMMKGNGQSSLGGADPFDDDCLVEGVGASAMKKVAAAGAAGTAIAGALSLTGGKSPQPQAKSDLGEEDNRREHYQRSGHLVYQAKMDQEKLECFYQWCQCMCCVKETMAKRSFVDVYTNGVMTNVPFGCCCCLWQDKVNFIFWDDRRFIGLRWGKADCCSPMPWCCPHGCNSCGDVLYANRCCVCGPCNSCALGVGHTSLYLWYGLFGFCVTDLICGLKSGEAQIVERVIQQAKSGQIHALRRAEYKPTAVMQ